MSLHASRRARFLAAMAPSSVAIIPTSPIAKRSHDTEYEFRPDSDFYYLTGFPEPEALAILDPRSADAPFTLVVRPRDPEQEVWNGRRAGVDGARDRFGANRAIVIDELPAELARALANAERVYYRVGRHHDLDPIIHRTIRQLAAKNRLGVWAPQTFTDPNEILAGLRLRKTADDVALARRAAAISAAGHVAAMRAVKPGMFEYELEAEVEYVFKKSGSPAPAYTSIVGSGENACILHYHDNDRQMRDGELVLVDAGAEWDGFSGDITRTFPVNGRFTRAQAEIYQLVHDAQQAAIDQVRPGACFQSVHDTALRVLTQGLIRLGFLSCSLEEAIEKESYKPWFMHRTSHWIGMDVHDVGWYRIKGEWRTLEPGMILTVEPGLYCGDYAPATPPEYRGIGVRIEDDVLVTATGNEVLTKDVPKAIRDVEAVVGGRLDA